MYKLIYNYARCIYSDLINKKYISRSYATIPLYNVWSIYINKNLGFFYHIIFLMPQRY